MSTQDNNYSFDQAAQATTTIDTSHQIPVGWFPDPESPQQQRYWDGEQWSQPRGNDTGLVSIVSKFSTWSLVLILAAYLFTGVIAGILAVTDSSPEAIIVVLFTVGFSMGVSGFFLGINGLRGHREAPGATGKGLAITSIVLGAPFFLLIFALLWLGDTQPDKIVAIVLLAVSGTVSFVTDQTLKYFSNGRELFRSRHQRHRR